jgi:hypothetical protein
VRLDEHDLGTATVRERAALGQGGLAAEERVLGLARICDCAMPSKPHVKSHANPSRKPIDPKKKARYAELVGLGRAQPGRGVSLHTSR